MHFKKIPKLICFRGKLTFQKNVLFWSVGDFHTQNADLLNLCDCGTVVYHRTTDVKVLSGRSWNPASGYLVF